MAAKTDIRTKLLKAALPDVVFDGWTDALVDRAAKKCKIGAGAAAKAFPAGAADLVAFFSEWADAETLTRLPRKKIAGLRIRDQIALGVFTRLEILAPHREAVRLGLSFMMKPPHNALMPKLVWKTADALWTRAGDTSTDYNRYTKRFLLSGVITAVTLYWLNDESEDFEKTKVFLDRRIGDVMTLGKFIGRFKKQAS